MKEPGDGCSRPGSWPNLEGSDVQHRTCSKCGESKPETVEFFRKRGNSARGGLRPDCRDCSAARDRAWGERNREHRKAYRVENAVTIAAYRQQHEAVYRKTPEGKAAGERARSRYAQTPKGKMAFRLARHRRAARLAQVRNDLTGTDWLAILGAFGQVCAYCGTAGDLFQEHVVPISKGGPNTRSNVVPACRSCNSRKFTTPLLIWFPRQRFYTDDRLALILAHVEPSL